MELETVTKSEPTHSTTCGLINLTRVSFRTSLIPTLDTSPEHLENNNANELIQGDPVRVKEIREEAHMEAS
jgi:hypothetical protein